MPFIVKAVPFGTATSGAVTVVALMPFPKTYMYPSELIIGMYPSAIDFKSGLCLDADPGIATFHMPSPVKMSMQWSFHPLVIGKVAECSVLYAYIFPSAIIAPMFQEYIVSPASLMYGVSYT